MSSISSLLRARRFGPFFLAQLFTAINENLYRNALLLLFAYHAGESASSLSPELLTSLAAGLFILPYFLFSTLAGRLADRMDKAVLMRRIKIAEIITMVLATLGFIMDWFVALLALIFVLGTLSAFFTPIKYSLLPEQLDESDLVTGTALVGLGTFFAVLVGTVAAGGLSMMFFGEELTAVAMVLVAIGGYMASDRVPRSGAASPHLSLHYNVFAETLRFWHMLRDNRQVFLCMLAVSWFWFLAVAYLSQFPNFVSQALNADQAVVTLMLTLFTLGIGAGALLCEKLSVHRIRLGLAPIGAVGISLAGIDLFLATPAQPPLQLQGFWDFVLAPYGWRILLDLLATGVAAGFYIVPLLAWVQQNTPRARRASFIAGLNIMNSAFMVASALSGAVLLGALSLPLPAYFLFVALANAFILMILGAQAMRRRQRRSVENYSNNS